MLNPKTTIPKLLGATLTLTGCSIDVDDTPPTSDWGSGLEALCKKIGTCNVEWRLTESECLERVSDLNFAKQYFVNPDCDELLASYYYCAADLSCSALRLPLASFAFASDELRACADFGPDEETALSCYGMLPNDFL